MAPLPRIRQLFSRYQFDPVPNEKNVSYYRRWDDRIS